MSQHVLVDPSPLCYDVGPLSTCKGASNSLPTLNGWIGRVNERLVETCPSPNLQKCLLLYKMFLSTLLQRMTSFMMALQYMSRLVMMMKQTSRDILMIQLLFLLLLEKWALLVLVDATNFFASSLEHHQ